MKKSVYALFLLLVCLFSLGGCSNESEISNLYEPNAFRIIRQTDSSGKIALTYIFPVNSAILEEKGFDESEIKTYRFYLSVYVNALAQQNRQKATDGVQVTGCVYYTDVDGLGFSIIFDDLESQKTFFGVEDSADSSSSSTKQSGFFFKKVKLQTNFPVSSVDSAENLMSICVMATTSWCTANNIENLEEILEIFDSSLFIYDFATTYNELKSDLMYDDDNFHHNVFIKTVDDIQQDATITFWTIYPNTPIWYITAVVTVILGMIIAYLILRRRKKN